MNGITHRFVETNGIRMHIAEAGAEAGGERRPLVLLCHGFPECWYSWRHQLVGLAAAGFHVVAPDQRGYGQTEAPAAVDAYTLLHLTGDLVGLLDALGAETAVIAGHDWGAPVAWHAALLRPDRFQAVIGLSGAYRPRGGVRPGSVMPQTADEQFYQLYFQQPGVAEAELEADVRATMRRSLYSLSGAIPETDRWRPLLPRSGGFLSTTVDPARLPGWLTEADLDVYTNEFSRSGFRGGLNWYRNIDRNWELLGAFSGAPITVPALFIAGEHDVVLRFPGMSRLLDQLSASVPGLRGQEIVPGAGHWVQQERPEAVNTAMLGFLRSLQTEPAA